MRHHHTSTREAKVQNTDNTKCLWGYLVAKPLLHLLVGMYTQWYSHFGRNFGYFLQKQVYSYCMIQQSCSLVFPQSSRKHIHTKSWIWGFIALYLKYPDLETTKMFPGASAKSLQSYPTLCDPIDSSPPGSPSLGFSRQEHWSGLPFPSPMHDSEKWKWRRSVVCDS